MNNLQIFKNNEFGEIRTIIKDNEPWFIAKDVSDILGYSETNRMTARLDDDESISTKLEGMNMKSTLINESGLYNAVLGSKLPSAKKFKKWVTSEVLPTIRKTGGFVSSEDLFINTYLPYLDQQTKDLFKTNLSMIRKQNEIIQLKEKEIKHKEEVIVGLVDEISLAEKRQILNRVVRYNGANFQERWRELYRQFEMKYHLNLTKRLEAHNLNSKPKIKNKVDYIDKVMNKVPELYEIACKLYENDVKELAHNLYTL